MTRRRGIEQSLILLLLIVPFVPCSDQRAKQGWRCPRQEWATKVVTPDKVVWTQPPTLPAGNQDGSHRRRP